MPTWLTNLILGAPSVGVPIVPSRFRERVHFTIAALGVALFAAMAVDAGLQGNPLPPVDSLVTIGFSAMWVGVGLWRRAIRLRRQGELDAFHRAVDRASREFDA